MDFVREKRIAWPDRRRFVQGLAFAGVGSAAGLWNGLAEAQGQPAAVLSGPNIDLEIGALPVNITGRRRTATVVNGAMPGPIIRLREGDDVTIKVANRLGVSTSIHWHGLRLPAPMDGVPGLTFAGIAPGETFTYRFPIKQSGTYWYHSHTGTQEQTGLHGPLILEPRGAEPFAYDREYVVMLTDWTDENPATIVSNLKQQGDYYNHQRPTLGDLAADAHRRGLGQALKTRLMWDRMRMSPADIMDVTGATYTFLVNGKPPAANWTALFKPGERVRLRFINGSAMTTFDVRIPGLDLTIVQADGSNVEPVTVDEFRIGVAETYDVLVEPRTDEAFTIFAQAQDRSGYARATLEPRAGMAAKVPPMDPPPRRTMADMGMSAMAGMQMQGDDQGAMSGMDHGMASMPAASAGAMDMSGHDMPAHDMPGMDHSQMGGMAAPGDSGMAGMDHGAMSGPAMNMGAASGGAMAASGPIPSANADGVSVAQMRRNPNVDHVSDAPMDRLAEAGDGLDGNGRRVLTYADLAAAEPADDQRPPDRELEFHLTGNMQRWVWGFDGKKFSESKPIPVKLGERVRFVLINDTMMEHPIHLHGFLFALENGRGARDPLKHTVNVKPNERLSFVFDADTPGHWAFHCHLLYHMETGMFRTVLVA